jgi:alpha-glucosidase
LIKKRSSQKYETIFFLFDSYNVVADKKRCHQLAMYVIFKEPLKMLSDNPTSSMKGQETTDLIAKLPTTFAETMANMLLLHVLKANSWYVGAMTNWTGVN